MLKFFIKLVFKACLSKNVQKSRKVVRRYPNKEILKIAPSRLPQLLTQRSRPYPNDNAKRQIDVLNEWVGSKLTPLTLCRNGMSTYFTNKYYQVANKRGDVYYFSEIFLIPPELIRTPPLLIFKKKFLLRKFLLPTCYISFLLLSKRKGLFDNYLKHFYLILFVYWPYMHLN